MAAAAILKNPTRSEAVLAAKRPYIVLKSNRKSGTASSFLCSFRHISTSGLARNGFRWPIFARNAHITLRSRQQMAQSATAHGTSADDRNTTSGSTGSQ